MEKVRPWCGQPLDRGRLKNRTLQDVRYSGYHLEIFESDSDRCDCVCYRLKFKTKWS